jgi:endonuclease-3
MFNPLYFKAKIRQDARDPADPAMKRTARSVKKSNPPMARAARPSPKKIQAAATYLEGLITLYPDPKCALDHKNAFELIVATILSAQCTDARVNMVTPLLFSRFPDSFALSKADLAEVEEIVHSTGFFRAKAKNLIAMAAQLVQLHKGEVPQDLDALTNLPGVGRKTAHVVLGNAFKIASGVVVDTHVKRLSYRLGLTKATDPEVIEHELTAILPQPEWINFSHRLIEHGRRVCDARKPACDSCTLQSLCPKEGVNAPKAKKK